MSSLLRYKKSGGFYQLLSLIETFGPQKKEKFLEMIEAESAAWAQALRDKMITLERIFSWPDQVVVEVFKHLPIKSQAYALQGLKEEQKAKIIQFYSSSEQRRLNDVITESQPKPEEIQATLSKLIEVSRKMIQDRELSPDKFDAALVIPEDYESKLDSQAGTKFGGSRTSPEQVKLVTPHALANARAEMGGPAPDGNASAEVYQLQRTLATVLKENKALKDEVKTLQIRLENIKKMAA